MAIRDSHKYSIEVGKLHISFTSITLFIKKNTFKNHYGKYISIEYINRSTNTPPIQSDILKILNYIYQYIKMYYF